MESILRLLQKEDLLDEFSYETNDVIDRKVQENLAKWQSTDKPLAPLNDSKLELIYQMREALNDKYFTPKEIPKETGVNNGLINNYKDFYEKYIAIEDEIKKEQHSSYDEHKTYVDKQSGDCKDLLNAVTIKYFNI